MQYTQCTLHSTYNMYSTYSLLRICIILSRQAAMKINEVYKRLNRDAKDPMLQDGGLNTL